MSFDTTILKRIQDKLQKLLKDQQLLKQENDRLKQTLKQAQEKLEQQQQEMENWKEKAAIAQYASGAMDDKEKKQFEKRINAYLREIDRCIALLSE
ncbi:MAG: hypothetical protein ACK4E0_09100 [Chitinophagaceae bacterium]